ncbi:hypothetical protein QZJ86_05755 [Methylomonas montana]|uniref:hypothetical protein n=1 Tax=Methylomonas montana TaxID=3058963 RepID=UPI002659E1D9|nr:hypothetical protein [Methylomonas montana]WKJ91639.1 hypothetical protein QZJ86_05755 [Methylomonas montana]
MKIERLYFTVDQLAEHWRLPIDVIMQLGLTNQLKFVAQADWEYPGLEVNQRGAHTPITFEDLANIYHATEPFCKTGVCQTSEDASLIGADVTITFYPGTDRLIIDATEVERFERENPVKQFNQNTCSLKLPMRTDDWFEAIREMVNEFYAENSRLPNETLAWVRLNISPPHGYNIEASTDKGGESCLTMPGVKTLSKSGFKKRWKEYTADNSG